MCPLLPARAAPLPALGLSPSSSCLGHLSPIKLLVQAPSKPVLSAGGWSWQRAEQQRWGQHCHV